MAADAGRPSRICTFVLMAVAFANCEVASHLDGIPSRFGIIFGCALLAASVAISYRLPALKLGERHPPSIWAAFLAVPLALEFIARSLADAGLPLELQLVNGLRVLGFGLAALAAWPACRKLAGITALFLAVFSAAMGDQAAMPYLLGLFAAVGGIWLLLEHRSESLGAPIEARRQIVGHVRLRAPFREAVAFVALAAVVGGIAIAGPERVRVRLGEWLPTSGGTGDIDLRARSGLGDGPEEAAGDRPLAAGMVETDTLIEDSNDALLDAANDSYGKPHKPQKNQERTAAADFMRVRENHGPTPTSRRPSRPFETSRRGPEQGARPLSRAGRGLYEVQGRTPLHIAIQVFDRFDASTSQWVRAAKPTAAGHVADGDDWMRTLPRAAPIAGDREAHHIKIADATGNVLPLPALADRFRIRRVSQADHFESPAEGVFAFAGRSRLPEGVVVQTESLSVAAESLPREAFSPLRVPIATTLAEPLRSEIHCLAQAWAGREPRGWPQIEAIRSRLALEYTLDPAAAAPEDHAAPALWFLRESRRGPDYLFASSATLLLQSLEYPARFVLGYYASPDAFDAETDHTPVRSSDLHAWCEVQLADGRWLVVEATPGYETLRPAPTWLERLAAAGTRLRDWCLEHFAACLLAGVSMLALVRFRVAIRDRLAFMLWSLAPGRTWDETVFRTLRLLERRARIAGCGRTATQTVREWQRRLDPSDGDLRALFDLVDRAAYDPADRDGSASEVRALCRRVLRDASTERLRRRTIRTGGAG